MKINLVMIVKNEERSLEQCLEQARGLVNEIVIADTGSTDRSVEIARKYGAKVWNMSGKTILRQPGILPSGIRTRSGI